MHGGQWETMAGTALSSFIKGDHTVLNEMLCGHLARRFKLPALEPVLVVVDAGPMGQINTERAKDGLAPIEPGAHFGAGFAGSFLAVGPLADVGADATANKIDNLHEVPCILGFDTMIQNNDRHCDNTAVEPNALKAGYSYWFWIIIRTCVSGVF